MSQQSEIFARYRSLFNSNSVKPTENEFSKKLANMDFVDFLFELVRATKGQKEFKNVILKGSLSQMKKNDEINKAIKKALAAKFQCDSKLIIPTKYTTKSSTGIEMTKNEIDTFGLLGIDPDTKPGNYMYEGNDPTKHVNYLLYKAQGVTEANPLSVNYNGNVLFAVYSIDPNRYLFKFGEFYENKQYNLWLEDYFKIIDPIFNTVNFTTILTDLITGAISIKAKKNKIEISKQSRTIKALQKLFGFCSEAPTDDGATNGSANDLLKKQLNNANSNGDGQTATQTGFGNSLNNLNNTTTGNEDDDPFAFDFNDLDEIDRDTQLRSAGKIRFSTCGDLDLDINPDDIISGLDLLFANANANDVYTYGDGVDNQLPNTKPNDGSGLYDNSEISPNADKAADFFDNALKNGAQAALDGGEDNININLPNMNAELQLNILKAIPYSLMQMVLTPKVMLIPKTFSVLNGDTSTKTNNDFVKLMSNVIKEIGAKITGMLIKNIFDAIKSDLTKLAKSLAIAFLKQRGLDYVSTLTSLLSLLGLFSGNTGGCGGVLGKLLKLLKLSNFGPMPMLPPPLILVGGALKPGMNSVAMVNDIKSKLTEKGIETAPTLPDGTPNNMMIAIEETVKVMTSHIKTNSRVETFGISAVGPVQGYGQIQ
jgi:hypothetical protein